MSGSSFSKTLSGLLRAQHGTALDDVEDSDLDKRIAEIMVKDAKERSKQWGTMGFTAYLGDEDDSEGPSRKTNKRFLASMIKNVDSHNQALIQQELDNAQQAQKERRRDDRSRLFGSAMQSASRARSDKGKERAVERDERDSRSRDEERSSSRRRSASPRESRRRHRDDHSDDSDYQREKEERRRRRREDDGHRSSRHRDENSRHSSHRSSRNGESSSRRHRDDEGSSRHRSRDEDRALRRDRDNDRRRHQEETEDGSRADSITSDSRAVSKEADVKSELVKTNGSHVNGESKAINGTKKLSKADLLDMHPTELFMLTGGTSIEPSPSPPPESKPRKRKARTPSPIARVRAPSVDDADDRPGIKAPPAVSDASSKMDKYFHASYDPRIDVNYDDMVDPITGFIKEGAYDDWEVMREVQKQQREYKKEKGVREAEERFQALEREAAKKKARERAADDEKDRKRRRKLGVTSDEDDYGPQPSSSKTIAAGYTAPAGDGMFGHRYVRKGGTREWDLGKETPT